MRGPRSCRIVFDGQSRLAIPTWDGFLGYSWARLVMAPRGLPGYLVAVSGQSITDLMVDFASRVKPKIASVEPCIYVMGDVGGSDIIDEGDSAATVYSQAGAMADAARLAGAAYVIVCTILPTQLMSPSMDATRLAANTLFMADASNKFDASVDIIAPELLDTSDLDYYADGTHVYGPHPVDGWGLGLGTPLVASIVNPFIDDAIDAVT